MKRRRPPWNPVSFSQDVDKTERVVRMWLRGEVIPSDITAIVRVLFGPDQDHFANEIAELRAIITRCRYKRSEKESLSESRSTLSAPRVFSDVSGDLALLNYGDLDQLPVDDAWRFDTVRYGEGVQAFVVPGSDLLWLKPTLLMSDQSGVRRSLTELIVDAGDDLAALAATKTIFLPRRIVISGVKRANAVVRIFACTNIPYGNGLDDSEHEHFSAEALLGMGGLAAFLDRDGNFRKRCSTEMGLGLGCVVALTAVAYVGRRPSYRTPYCLAVRKGIRHPDDVWLSPATGTPVFSATDAASGRFLFQSRESKGGSVDMFAANFNGSGLFNLNETDDTAWDGFVDEDGKNLVEWHGNNITFGSTITGKGFIEKMTREDRS